MLQASQTRFHQLFDVAIACALFGGWACVHGYADENEKATPKQPAPSNEIPPKSLSDSVRNPELQRELLARMTEDQDARKQWLRLLGQPRESNDAKKQIDQAMTKLRRVDHENLARMKQIVERFGWPGKTLVGSDGAQAAWLLVQHADSDLLFQKRCLALIIAAVKQGEAKPEQMAYLTDRVRVAEKRKQVYGTQFHEVGGRQEPYPIENEAEVDRRRKEVGMPPMAEYRKMIDQMYPHGTPKKSR